MKTLEFKPLDESEAVVTAYLHSPLTEQDTYRKDYPVVVVCPGGGYEFCSQRESDPVAFEYLTAGYNVFTLIYSTKEKARAYRPLKELSLTIMAIRENAKEWGCDPDKIAVIGFSAGGHLAGSIATLWNNKYFLEEFDNKGGLNKPNAVILSYAVLSSDEEIYHGGSIKNVSGVNERNDLWNIFSIEKQVNKDCPPAFLWHTVEDDVVPIENSIRYITEMQKLKIPYEAHFFPTGGHGMSVCTKEVGSYDEHNAQWVELSKKWLGKTFDYKL